MKISKKFVAIFLIILGLLLMTMVPLKNYLVNNTKKPIITLITCANGGSMRWCIRGVLQ